MDRQEQIGGAAEILNGEVEEQPLARRAASSCRPISASYRELREMAWSKIVGLEVRPVTDSSSI
jgi:hypothetical protein